MSNSDGWVIKTLKAGRYLHEEAGTDKRLITNYYKLLDRWASAWPEKLKHKHLLGTFSAEDPNWWKHINIQKYDGYWGGETAAAIYTKHLLPQVSVGTDLFVVWRRLIERRNANGVSPTIPELNNGGQGQNRIGRRSGAHTGIFNPRNTFSDP